MADLGFQPLAQIMRGECCPSFLVGGKCASPIFGSVRVARLTNSWTSRMGRFVTGPAVKFIMMDSDEREIFYYLKSAKREYFGPEIICRHSGGRKRYLQDRDWAKPVLMRMLARGILETNASGCYRLRPVPSQEAGVRRWVSPHIAKALARSGQKIEGHVPFNDDEAFYNSL